MTASSMGLVEIIKILHAAGADTHAMDSYGFMPIHSAAYYGQLASVMTLIELGEDVNDVSVNFYHFTALHVAAYYGRTDMVEYLVELGADLDLQSDYENTDQGHTEIVEILTNASG